MLRRWPVRLRLAARLSVVLILADGFVYIEVREEALSGIMRAFALGAPFALLLASGIGYGVGGRALAPVEAMRSRARGVTLFVGDEGAASRALRGCSSRSGRP